MRVWEVGFLLFLLFGVVNGGGESENKIEEGKSEENGAKRSREEELTEQATEVRRRAAANWAAERREQPSHGINTVRVGTGWRLGNFLGPATIVTLRGGSAGVGRLQLPTGGTGRLRNGGTMTMMEEPSSTTGSFATAATAREGADERMRALMREQVDREVEAAVQRRRNRVTEQESVCSSERVMRPKKRGKESSKCPIDIDSDPEDDSEGEDSDNDTDSESEAGDSENESDGGSEHSDPGNESSCTELSDNERFVSFHFDGKDGGKRIAVGGSIGNFKKHFESLPEKFDAKLCKGKKGRRASKKGPGKEGHPYWSLLPSYYDELRGWSHKRHNKLALPRFETLRRRMNDEGLGHWSVAARSTNRPRLVVKRHWREVAKEDNETGGSGKKRTTKHEKMKASSKKANEKKGKIDKDKKKKDKKKAKRRQSFEYDAPSRKDDRSNDGSGRGNGGRGGDGPGSCPLPVYAL